MKTKKTEEGVNWVKSEEWANNLTERMEKFESTAEDLLEAILQHGVHSASPMNMSLPTILNLCAGWLCYESALACEHCRDEIGLREGGPARANEALNKAEKSVRLFMARLLLALGDEVDEDGTATPWLPEWVKPEYDKYLKADTALPDALPAICHAVVFMPWGKELGRKYLSMLVMEAGIRLGRLEADATGIEKIRKTWPDPCVHDALEQGAMEERDGIDWTDQMEAWDEAQSLFESYLDIHNGSDELTLPPPGLSLH